MPLWQSLRDPKTREVWGWIGGSVTAIVGGLWTAFVYFFPGDSVRVSGRSSSCITADAHPNSSALIERTRVFLRKNATSYIWHDVLKSTSISDVNSSADVTGVFRTEDQLIIRYAWGDGQLKLRPVVFKQSSTTVGAVFQGEWVQDNGTGCVELILEPAETVTKAIASGWYSLGAASSEKESNSIELRVQQAVALPPVPPRKLPDQLLSKSEEIDLLARLVYAEARAETFEAQRAVANVVLNRRKCSGKYSDTLAGVINQPHQFSSRLLGDPNFRFYSDQINDDIFRNQILKLSADAVEGRLVDNTGGATLYHYVLITPAWVSEAEFTVQFDKLKFYRLRGTAQCA